MKSKYILSFQNTKGSIAYEYEDGILSDLSVSDDAELTKKQRFTVLQKTAIYEKKIQENLTFPGFILKPVPDDLSFEHFWKEYNNPASKKKYTQNQWNQRSEAEKIQMLEFLPKLKRMKKLDGTQMPYASTYINQESWKV